MLSGSIMPGINDLLNSAATNLGSNPQVVGARSILGGTEITIWYDNFERATLGSNWTINGPSSYAGIGNHTSNSGTRSMYTRHGSVNVTSTAINLSGYTKAQVRCWVRMGHPSFSEDPDNGEDLVMQYKNSNNNWVQITRFFGSGTPGRVYNISYNLSTNAFHKGFKLRFYQTGGSGSGCDYWHIDDVKIISTIRYDHDIEVYSINIPKTGKLMKPNMISALIINQGKNKETNITVQLKVDDVVKNSTKIISLATDAKTTINLNWTPKKEKIYDIQIYAIPVTSENYTSNNYLSGKLNVKAQPEIWKKPHGYNLTTIAGNSAKDNLTIGNNGIGNLTYEIYYGLTFGVKKEVLIYTQYADMGYNGEFQNTLRAINQTTTNYNYKTFNDYRNFNTSITGKNILLIPEQERTSYSTMWSIGNIWKVKLNEFLSAGGTIILCDYTSGGYGIYVGAGLMNISSRSGVTSSQVTVVDSSSPLAKNVNSTFTAPNGAVGYSTSEKVVICTSSNLSVVIDKKVKNGNAILIGFDYYSLSSSSANKIVGNAILYYGGESTSNWLKVYPKKGNVTQGNNTTAMVIANASMLNPGYYSTNFTINSNDLINQSIRVPVNLTVLPAPHDLRLLKIQVPSHGEAGKFIQINCTILNQGTNNESNITVQLKVNDAVMNYTFIDKISINERINITLAWKPMGENKFKVEIYIVPVPNETQVHNNGLNGTILVTAEADIWVEPSVLELVTQTGTSNSTKFTLGNDGLASLNYKISHGRKIVSGGTFHKLPPDPNYYVARHDIFNTYWNDGNRDAFDGYAYTRLYVGKISQGYLPLSNNTTTTNGFKYKTTLDWPDNNVFRFRIEPVSETRNDITVIISGDLGSDSSTQAFYKTFDFCGYSIKYLVTNDGSLDSTSGDPQIHHYVIPSNPLDLSKVSYSVSSDNPYIIAGNISLPVTIYIIPSYLSHKNVTEWVISDLEMPGENWLSFIPDNGSVAPINKTEITAVVNATLLEPGRYFTNFTIVNNDPVDYNYKVPVNLTVTPVQHDIRVLKLNVPNHGEAGKNILVQPKIKNQGLNNESNITVQFWIDGVLSNYTSISFLEVGTWTNVDFIWKPMKEKNYDLEIIVIPVLGEERTTNNQLGKIVKITAESDIQVNPKFLNLVAIPGDFANDTLTIENNGLGELIWNVENENLVFYDGFEEGNYNNWNTSFGSNYTRSVTSSTAAGGTTYSFKQTGGNRNHNDGIYKTFNNIRPGNISFYVRSSSNSSADGFFIVRDQANRFIMYFYAHYNGYFVLYTGSNQYNYVYQADRWYHIEFKNINWQTQRFEYYIDRNLISNNVPFRDSYYNMTLNRIDLYNWDYSTSWYDEIRIGSGQSGETMADWLTIYPKNGTVPPMNLTNLNVNANAKFLRPGVHRTNITIFSNDPEDQCLKVPVNLTVQQMDHDIRVFSLSVPIAGEVGKVVLTNSTILNQGLYNETNITIQLKVNGNIKNTTKISSLNFNSKTNIQLGWNPTGEKIYTVEIYAVPVQNEIAKGNNKLSESISITAEPYIEIKSTEFNLTAIRDMVVQENITIRNTGYGTLNWSLKSNLNIFESFPTTSFNTSIWIISSNGSGNGSGSVMPVINTRGMNEPSPPYSLNFDGSGDVITSIKFDLSSSTSTTLEFYCQLGGGGESPDSGDYLKLEYYTSTGSWVTAWIIYGKGYNIYNYNLTKISLPANARHSQFQFRFTSRGSGSGMDDFFIDDLYLNYTSSAIDWLTFSKTEGSINKLSKTVISFWADASKVTPGVHKRIVTINSNDKDKQIILIQIIFNVKGITLEMDSKDLAPKNVHQFESDVNMLGLTLRAINRAVLITSITLNYSGSASHDDISDLRLILDTDSSGNFTLGDTIIDKKEDLTGSQIRFLMSRTIPKNQDVRFIIVCNISYSATIGEFLGFIITDNDIRVKFPAEVEQFGIIQTSLSQILERIDYLSVSPKNVLPGTLIQGQKDILAMKLGLHSILGSVTLKSIELELIGTGNSGHISMVSLYHDSNGNGEYESSKDNLLSFNIFKGTSLVFDDFTLNVINGTDEFLFISFDLYPDAKLYDTIGLSLKNGFVKVKAPDLVLKFDTCDAGPIQISPDITKLTPKPPKGLTIKSVTFDSITLGWDENKEKDVVGYNLYRSENPYPEHWGGPINGLKPIRNLGYLDSGLNETTTYYYVITAVTEFPLESEYSDTVYGKTLKKPTAPAINIPMEDFEIPEDTIDDHSINLYQWFKDDDGDELKFWCTGQSFIDVDIDSKSGKVTLTPARDWNGVESVTFYASDITHTSSDVVNITITPVNDPPVDAEILMPKDGFKIDENETLVFKGYCNDVDIIYGDVLNYTWHSNISGKFGYGEVVSDVILPPGVHKITLEVYDLIGDVTMAYITISVIPIKEPDDGIIIPPDDIIDDDDKRPKEEDDLGAFWILLGLNIIVMVIIILIFLFMYLRKKKKGSEVNEGPIVKNGLEPKQPQNNQENLETSSETPHQITQPEKKLPVDQIKQQPYQQYQQHQPPYNYQQYQQPQYQQYQLPNNYQPQPQQNLLPPPPTFYQPQPIITTQPILSTKPIMTSQPYPEDDIRSKQNRNIK